MVPVLTHRAQAAWRALAQTDAARAQALLPLAAVILTVWAYYGRHTSLALLGPGLGGTWPRDVLGALYEYTATWLALFALPALVVGLVFRQPLAAYGLTLG
ncbi:MAG: hypothetical protein V1772_12590, partial [Chloroflexota bacterium]